MLKAMFISGLFLGLAAVFAGAGYYPWIDHPRLAARTQVLPNGGRSETFLVRLPVDRIAAMGGGGGLAARSFPPKLALPDALAAEAVQLDHFKVRDVAGNVIGIAARHAVGTAQGVAVVWSLTIPSRGTLWLSGVTAEGALDTALDALGYESGETWSGELSMQYGGHDAVSGQVIGGSDEFAALGGSYTEHWYVTGIDDTGELRGTIELATLIASGS